jgi:glyceraldehyde 3-phosphate dehydrogenase
MNKKRIAINGFGRIGRAFLRQMFYYSDIEVVAINDLGTTESLAYLLQYDTVYKKFDQNVQANGENAISIGNTNIAVYHEKDPSLLPWGELGIDCVLEATGLFTQYDKANAHIIAGAKSVVISAPAKDDPTGAIAGETILIGVNGERFGKSAITSNASCTTNAASPLIAVLNETLGIESALLSTTHGYTATQALVDGPSKKDLREGRAAAQNIVPSSTGAAKAVTVAYPELAGKFDGISLRVPVPAGSIVDVTFVSKRPTTAEEVVSLLESASQTDRWHDILRVSHEPLVSSDIIGERVPCIVDAEMTRVVNGNLVKVLAWYDNEYGYTGTLVRHVQGVVSKL